MLRIHRTLADRALVRKVEAYLLEAFGLHAVLTPEAVENLPYFLADRYTLWRTDLFGRTAILMAPRQPAEIAGDEMARHVELVRSRADTSLVILVLEALSPTRRRTLMERRVAFLAPDAQLFIPEALLDLRERTPRAKAQGEAFTPTAQLLILGALLGQAPEDASATALARRYGVAIMSITRAFDELETAHVADAGRDGRERRLRFQAAGRELWNLTGPRLQTPVRKVRTVVVPYPQEFPGLLAGESALARYTSLASPRVQRLAVASARWNQLVRDHGLREAERGDPDADEIETWSYDPAALTNDRTVDRLSLHLSLRNHPDERVAGAADEILEHVAWS